MRRIEISAGSSEKLDCSDSSMLVRDCRDLQIRGPYYQKCKLGGCKDSIVRVAAISEYFLQET